MSGLVINEDNSHYFLSRGAAGADIEKVKELTSHYCIGQVSEVKYNFMAQRANVTGLNVEPIWHEVEDRGEAEGMFFRGRHYPDRTAGWVRCAKGLHEQGIDPYRVWLDETRRLGRRATLSMRMNDCHDIEDDDHFFHCEFWRNHPEYRLDTSARESGYGLYWVSALDYTHEEVRAYKLNIIKAVLERYDMDGLEIDWMRHGYNVGLSNVDAGRAALTDFHRQVRALADGAEKRLGHPVTISARVSAAPEDAFARGMDVAAWVREGLVQEIIPTAFWATSDTGMPISLWRSILGGDVKISAGMELLVRPFPASDTIGETSLFLAGQAADYYYQGADQIYLFNHMDSQTAMADPEDYKRALSIIGTPETAYAAHRRHVITYHDFVTFGIPISNALPAPLPANRFSGHLRLSIGPKPEAGRKCRLILGFDTEDIPEFELRMNCRLLKDGTKIINSDEGLYEDVLSVYGSKQNYPKSSIALMEFDVSDAVVAGTNLLWLKNREDRCCNITWVEIAVDGLSR